MDSVLPDYISKARSKAQNLGQQASQYAAGEYSIPDELKKVVQEALDYNKDVVSKRSSTFQDYLKAPEEGNVRFGVQNFSTGQQAGQANPNFIFNPFERNKAIADFTSSQAVPFQTYNTLLGLREGTVADTVDAGTRAYQAASQDALGRATGAQDEYKTLLDEFKTQKDFDLRERELEQKQQGSTIPSELLAMITGGGQPTEPKPTKKPRTSQVEKGVQFNSPEGQWTYKDGEWQPSGGKATGGISDFFTDPNKVLQLMVADPENRQLYAGMSSIAQEAAKKEGSQDSMKNISSTLDQLETAFTGTGYIDRINPLSTKGIELGRFKDTLGVILAKEVEQGRMSDADRAFYLNQLPAPWMTSAQAKAAISGVKQGLTAKLGGGEGEKKQSLEEIFG